MALIRIRRIHVHIKMELGECGFWGDEFRCPAQGGGWNRADYT